MALKILETTKTLVSSLFAGMANNQVKRGDYSGTKWRARIALNYASNPMTQLFAHAVNAKAERVGKNYPAMLDHINTALSIYQTTPDLQVFAETKSLVMELEAMRNEPLENTEKMNTKPNLIIKSLFSIIGWAVAAYVVLYVIDYLKAS